MRSAQQSNPLLVLGMARGLLHNKGHRVQRERIRQSFLRTDPIGVMQRWRYAVRRRRYNVHSSLALWHIDGNHTLIGYILTRNCNYVLIFIIRTIKLHEIPVRVFTSLFKKSFDLIERGLIGNRKLFES